MKTFVLVSFIASSFLLIFLLRKMLMGVDYSIQIMSISLLGVLLFGIWLYLLDKSGQRTLNSSEKNDKNLEG